MSDVVSAKFEADANDFVREISRARDSLKKLSASDLPLVKQEMDRAFLMANRTSKGLQQVGAAGFKGGQGLLQLAYFADDAQYGLRGIQNNIPGLLSGLGAGAGLAGAVSLVTLAAATAWPHLEKLYSNADTAGAVEGAKKYTEALKENLEEIRKLNVEKERQNFVDQLRQNVTSSIQSRPENQNAAIIKQRITLLEKERVLEDKIASARGQDAVETARIAKQRLEQDLQLQKELAAARGRDFDDAEANAENFAASFEARIAAQEEAIEKTRQNAAFSAASVPQAQAEFDEVKDKGFKAKQIQRHNLDAVTKRAEQDKKALEDQLAMLAALEEEAARADEIFSARRRAAADEGKAAGDRALALEKEIAAQQQILDIQKEKAAAAEQERKSREAAETARALEKDQQKSIIDQQREKSRLEREAQLDFAKKEKDQSREKLALEKKALADAALAENVTQRPSGRVRLFRQGESAGGAFAGAIGLRSTIGSRLSAESAADARLRRAADAKPDKSIESESLGVLKKMSAFWEKKLGVV